MPTLEYAVGQIWKGDHTYYLIVGSIPPNKTVSPLNKKITDGRRQICSGRGADMFCAIALHDLPNRLDNWCERVSDVFNISSGEMEYIGMVEDVMGGSVRNPLLGGEPHDKP